jgi:hypothetical protein
MIIYLDFDGTVVEHEYPKIGRCNFGCVEVLKKLQDAGHTFILNTYRVECKDNSLEDALKWFEDSWMFFEDKEGDPCITVTEHTKSKYNPPTWDWDYILSKNEMYIDDIAYGIPLKKACMVNNMMVDWDVLDKQFEEKGLYEKIK